MTTLVFAGINTAFSGTDTSTSTQLATTFLVCNKLAGSRAAARCLLQSVQYTPTDAGIARHKEFQVRQVPPDGDCLYHSLLVGLSCLGLPSYGTHPDDLKQLLAVATQNCPYIPGVKNVTDATVAAYKELYLATHGEPIAEAKVYTKEEIC